MNKLPSLALALGVTLSIGLAPAQTIDQSPTNGTSNRGKPTKEQITGEVVEVNSQAKTFTVTAKGKTAVFSGANLPRLPQVGEVVDVTYTQTPGGGPLTSTAISTPRRRNAY